MSNTKRYLDLLAMVLAVFFASAGFSEAHGAISKGLDKGIYFSKSELPATLRNWGLDNSFKSHIDVRRAWGINRGSRAVVVAVIDTGIDPEHPALRDNLWQKPGAKGREYGWDFVKNAPNPKDVHGHGTHIAGIIGAAAASDSGVAGVAQKVSIMALRFHGEESTDTDTIENTVKAIQYAVDNGAHIINYSAGGRSFSGREKKAVEYAASKGVLLIAAAGNHNHDADKAGNQFYPASYALDNTISVAGTDVENHLVASSNWGPKTVHISAPGENIYSTLPGGKYGYLTGTSQGAAFVTGVAALLMAQDPSLRGNPKAVKDIILQSADKIDELDSKIVSGGRLNAYAALKAAVQRVSGGAIAGNLKPFRRNPANRNGRD